MWVTGKGCRVPFGLPGVLQPDVPLPLSPFVPSPFVTPLSPVTSMTAMQARIAQLEAQVRECQAQMQKPDAAKTTTVKSKQFIFLLPRTALQPLPPLAADVLRTFLSSTLQPRPLQELLGELHVMEVAEAFDNTGCMNTPAGRKVAEQVDADIEKLSPDQPAQFFAAKHKLSKYCLSQEPTNEVFRDSSILMALAANVSFVAQALFLNMPGYGDYSHGLVMKLIPAFLQGGAAVQEWLDTYVAAYIDRLTNHPYPSGRKGFADAAKMATKYKEFVAKVIKA
jgi:hypothetical protein